jgi:branched-chain amino acid transport system substrate-binding protein
MCLAACMLAGYCVSSVQAAGGDKVTTGAGDKSPIKIGFVGSLSSIGGEIGLQMLNGTKLYLDEIHYTMAGRKIELMVENDESNPATGVAKVRKLGEQDKVPLMCGMVLAHVCYGIAPVVEKLQTPFVVLISGADDVTQRKRTKWMVRTSYTASQPGHPLGEYACKKLRLKRVVTIASDYAYGYEIVGGFQKTFEESGGQVIQKLWAPLGFKDFTPLLKQVNKDADAVFMCMAGPSAAIIAKQYREMGFKMPIIGATASFTESIYPNLGDELVGAISSSPYSAALPTPANKRFVETYRTKYGQDPAYFAEFGYSGCMFMHKAIEALKGNLDDKDKVLSALSKTQLADAPRGPIKIDSYGNVVDNIYICKVERVKGKLQNTVVYTYPNVSQFWKYKPDEYMKQPSYSKDYPPCTHCIDTKPQP